MPTLLQPEPARTFRRLQRDLRSTLGIDAPIFYSLTGKTWSLAANSLSLILIARYLSRAEQGYYYTFFNILGIRALFELGLSFVLIQVTSHEFAHLRWIPAGVLEGAITSKARLASLLRQVMKWYTVVAILTLIAILPGGALFFGAYGRTEARVEWAMPWIFLCVMSTAGIWLTPILAILEGCNLITQLARLRLFESIGASLSLWLGLLTGHGLFGAALAASAMFFIDSIWLCTKRHFIRDLLSTEPVSRIAWRTEVWPFQWRIALSWSSGYLIFQLFNPLAFALFGSIVAGRVGMSMTIIQSILALAMTWLTTKMAPFGRLAALHLYAELDKLFFRSVAQAFTVLASSCGLFLALIYWMKQNSLALAGRVLDPGLLVLICLATICNFVWSAEALYLRSHKREPYARLSLASGVACAFSAYYLGKSYGPQGMMSGFLAVSFVFNLGLGTYIFWICRTNWHLAYSHAK